MAHHPHQKKASLQDQVYAGSAGNGNRFSKYRKGEQKKGRSERLEEILSSFTYTSLTDIQASKLSSGSYSSKSTRLTDSDRPRSIDNLHGEFSPFQLPVTEPFLNLVSVPLFELDSRKPIYIQHFSKLNSAIPNYQHPGFTIKQQLKSLSVLLETAMEATQEVKRCAIRLASRQKRSEEVRQLGLKFVCESVCDTCSLDDSWTRLRPHFNFDQVLLTSEEWLEKIELIESKIQRYQIVLSLTRSLELGLCMRIRETLAEMEEELMAVSNSIYLTEKKSIHYPSFCYAYVELLSSQPALP